MTDTLLIAPGDTVTLKSGGPAMTVEGMHPAPHSVAELVKQTGNMARVAWADATGAIHEHAFWLHMLAKKAEDKAPAAVPAPAPAAVTARDNSMAPRGPVFKPSAPASDDDRDNA